MITKGIIEEVVTPYELRVRLPLLDRAEQSSLNIPFEDLRVGLVSTLPNCKPNLQVGDVVFVSVDDASEDEAVIVGYLYREASTETYCDMILEDLEVKYNTTLSSSTRIGDVQPQEIHQLLGVRENIQKQLDDLNEKLKIIQNSYITVQAVKELLNPSTEATD